MINEISVRNTMITQIPTQTKLLNRIPLSREHTCGKSFFKQKEFI